jgi:uncharacterized membrane protein
VQPSEDVPDQGRPVSSPSLLVTRVVPLMLAVQVLLTLASYPFLPNTVASHWNAAGQVDSYEAKWVYAGFLPIFSLLLYIMLAAFIAFSRSPSSSQDRRAQQNESAKMILKFVMLMQQVIFLITQAILLLIALRAGSGAVR